MAFHSKRSNRKQMAVIKYRLFALPVERYCDVIAGRKEQMTRIMIMMPVCVSILVVMCCVLVVPATLAQSNANTPALIARFSQLAAAERKITPIEFVKVGDPNNPSDKVTQTGQVNYVFEIGKYEVTNAHYCEFLNAVAVKADPHGLYNINMDRGLFGGIKKLRTNEGYRYEPIYGYENLPVVYVSWYDAARFCNWLHYGKPITGRCAMGTTEGNDRSGSYDTRDFDIAPRGIQRVKAHNRDAKYWIPTIDEWNKAAFYDPTKNGRGEYWLYATCSDEKPVAVPPGDTPNSANYYGFKWAAPPPYMTPVGGYKKSASYYGTYDQNGNVFEWIETLRTNGKQRWIRGGALTQHSSSMIRTNRDCEFGDHELYLFGFRVCRRAVNKPKPLIDLR